MPKTQRPEKNRQGNAELVALLNNALQLADRDGLAMAAIHIQSALELVRTEPVVVPDSQH